MQNKTYDKFYDFDQEGHKSNTENNGVNYEIENIKELDCLQELRVETDARNAITVTLLKGFAEIFGAELPPEVPLYYPKGSKFAIFTWHKAEIKITGEAETLYVSEDTKMREYIEIHSFIQEDRENARAKRQAGPNIIVCGSPSSGKTTVCQILTNYALKMGYRPILVDLDLDNNMIVPTGCMGAAKPKLPLPHDDMNEESVCLYSGFNSSNLVPKLYRKQYVALSKLVNSKIKNKSEQIQKEYADLVQNKEDLAKINDLRPVLDEFSTSETPVDLASGCIINAMITSSEAADKTINDIAARFNANYIIIIDLERLFIKLNEENKTHPKFKLLKLPRSPGAEAMDEQKRRMAKEMTYKNYFYGKMGGLDTFEVGLDLSQYKLYTTEVITIPLSALPTGAKQEVFKIIVKRIDPNEVQLQNRIIGVLEPSNVEKLETIEKEIEEGESNNKEEFYDMITTSLCRSLLQVNYYDQDKNQLIVNATSPDGPKSNYLIFSENCRYDNM